MGFFQTWTTEVTGNNPHPERDPRWMFDKGNEASTSFLFFVAASLLTMTPRASPEAPGPPATHRQSRIVRQTQVETEDRDLLILETSSGRARKGAPSESARGVVEGRNADCPQGGQQGMG